MSGFGGIIGGILGIILAPTGFGALGFAIGSTIGSALFPPSAPDQVGPRLSDLKVQTSAYGGMIPILMGTVRTAGNVIWSTDLKETKHESSSGGKGGGGGTVTTFTYSVSCAVSLCKGPIQGVRRIWADSVIVYDISSTNTGLTQIDTLNFVEYFGTEIQTPDPTMEADKGVGNVCAYRGQAYVVFTDFQLEKFGNRVPNFTFEIVQSGGVITTVGGIPRIDPTSILLSSVITDLSLMTPLTTGDLDLTSISDTIDGYVISTQASVRSAIGQLQNAYIFDAVESDLKVKFVKRGGTSTVAIPVEDLAVHNPDENLPPVLATVRTQEIDLPNLVTIKYLNRATNYQPGAQQSKRMVGSASSVSTIELAIVLTDDKAKQVADATLYALWAGRTTYSFQTSYKYAAYEPTDVITVDGFVLRITKKDESLGIIKWEAVAENTHVYGQTSTGATAPVSTSTIASIALTDLQLLDIPILRDEDDNAGFYSASSPESTAVWTGSVLFKSVDGGVNYDEIGSNLNPSTVGTSTTTLATFPAGDIFDETNTVTVTMTYGTLVSLSELAVLNGGNPALLGSEIIQFKNANLVSTGIYTLSGLLRGRKGTEWAMDTHTSTDRFVMLTTALSRPSPISSEIGLLRKYKGVTFGKTLASATAQDFTNTAVGLKPYAPVQLGGGRASNGDLTIAWVRRTRLSGEWRDNIDVPLGETVESYTVEIWNSSFTSIVHTFTGITVPTLSYTSAEQIADFGSNQSSLNVKVYQLSASIGLGYPLKGTV